MLTPKNEKMNTLKEYGYLFFKVSNIDTNMTFDIDAIDTENKHTYGKRINEEWLETYEDEYHILIKQDDGLQRKIAVLNNFTDLVSLIDEEYAKVTKNEKED